MCVQFPSSVGVSSSRNSRHADPAVLGTRITLLKASQSVTRLQHYVMSAYLYQLVFHSPGVPHGHVSLTRPPPSMHAPLPIVLKSFANQYSIAREIAPRSSGSLAYSSALGAPRYAAAIARTRFQCPTPAGQLARRASQPVV
jgi:hypothetical protein